MVVISTLLAIHIGAEKLIIISAVIIWVLTVGSVLFGVSKINKANSRK